MLAPSRQMKRSKKMDPNSPQKFRETPMTMPEMRYYKEDFRPAVNIRDFTGSSALHKHTAPDPDAHPRADAKTTARMMKSNVMMFPNEKDKDTFTAPAKRSNAASNMFMQSDSLFGTDPPRQAQKKLSAVKVAEIGGSGTVKPMGYDETRNQKL